MQKKVLLIDDEESVRLSLGFWLRRNNFAVTLCGGTEDAGRALERNVYDYVISDFRLTPRGEEGVALLAKAREINPAAKCILVTATPANELPTSLERVGVYSLHQKPVDVFELLRLLGPALP
ncbi:MAG: response regulator [Gemmatimonadales bacterium]|nr:response regulator [Gemmatimonadales bacterium]